MHGLLQLYYKVGLFLERLPVVLVQFELEVLFQRRLCQLRRLK